MGNANGERCGGTLTEAFIESCNSVFAPLGAKLGAKRLVQRARAFGFGERSTIPSAKPSTISPANELRDALAVGAAALGQDRDLATPLQMATVAATIAAGGRRARPRIATIDPVVRRRVISARTARQVRSMMIGVVRSGTGTAAALPGVQVAGKTGTAELRANSKDPEDANAWFVAFAPARQPQIAVAVMLIGGGSAARPRHRSPGACWQLRCDEADALNAWPAGRVAGMANVEQCPVTRLTSTRWSHAREHAARPARPGEVTTAALEGRPAISRLVGGRLLIGAVVAIAVATLVGLVALWPHGDSTPRPVATGFVVPALLAGRPAIRRARRLARGDVRHARAHKRPQRSDTLGVIRTHRNACADQCHGGAREQLRAPRREAQRGLGSTQRRQPGLSLQGVVTAGIVIGALGVLACTGVTGRLLWHCGAPTCSCALASCTAARSRSARDHLSATIRTLVLARRVPRCLGLNATQRTVIDTLNFQDTAEPIIATAIGCAGLIAAVALTTALSALQIPRVPVASLPHGHSHAH